ncbi:MAG: hypothetical protein Q7K71_04790 [Candidatus Omnitrophota bacterium]|nr:hypothetical protein [Candidatus Omnitrophota bacterium]
MNITRKIGTWLCLISLICPAVWAKSEPMTQVQKARIIHEEWVKNQDVVLSPKGEGPQRDPSAYGLRMTAGDEMQNALTTKVTVKAQDLPLSVVLKPLAQSIGYQLLLGPGVEDKKVNVDLSDAPVSRVLNTVLYPLGYGFKAKDGDLVILSQETRIYRVVLPPIVQTFNDTTSNESFVQSANAASTGINTNPQQIKLGTKVLVNNKALEISFWDDIAANLKTLISPGGQFSANKPAGSVVVTDTPGFLDRIGQYFDELNRRVAQQIDVDVKVVEVALSDEHRFGVDWNALAESLKTLNSLGMATNFASGNFTSGQFLTFNADGPRPGSGVSAGGIKLAIDALAKQGRVEVVSQPRLTILNNQTAVIQVGSTQSFVDKTTFETTQTGTITSISTSQVQEGVTMRLLGNIVGDQIYLSVTPVVTTIDNIRSITSGTTTIEAPQTTTKSINTLVKLREGQTVAIGGLITSYVQKTKQGVPVVSKIPVLGKLFEYSQNKNNKTELVIFITPRKI